MIHYKSTIFFSFFLLLSISTLLAQTEVNIESNDVTLYGTLQEPTAPTDTVVLIISGSGETNRDGNTTKVGYVNNCLKMLAETLAENNIASLRYDKRGVEKSNNGSVTPENLRFNQFIQDAEQWIEYLQPKYKKIIVAGHSQGALVGMGAIQNKSVAKFISISGIAEDLHTTITKQLANQPAFVLKDASPILDSLQKGVRVDSVPQYLNSLFAPRIQDYFISFMKFDPVIEIQKVTVPILIIQGTNDLQISVETATHLATKNENTQLTIIKGMNHVLKSSEADQGKNLATYAMPDLPLHKDLIPSILAFIKD